MIKDWKKVGVNQWNKGNQNLAIESLGNIATKYIMWVIDYKEDKDITSKIFKTKKAALKFAKSYMSNH